VPDSGADQVKDMTVKDAEAIVAAVLAPDMTIEELEDFSFVVLKAVAVMRKDLEEKEKTFG
jgi:hypothetical protein